MAQNKVTGMDFEEFDKSVDMTEEKKKKIESFRGNEKLVMPIPGDHKTDKTIRIMYSKDDGGNDIVIRNVHVDTGEFAGKILQFVSVEDYDNQGIVYDMNWSKSLNNAMIRIAGERGVTRKDLMYKWLRLSANTYEHEKFGESKSFSLRYLEDLNSVVKAPVNKASSMF